MARSRILLFGLLLASWLDVATSSSSLCSYGCDNCANSWYEANAAGRCEKRTAEKPTCLAVAYKCRLDEMTIRDEQSCMDIIHTERLGVDFARHRVHHQYVAGEVYANFSTSRGCKIVANESLLFGLEHFESEICFGQQLWLFMLGTQIAAIAIGVLLGFFSRSLTRKCKFHDHLADSVEHGVTFRPGARTVVMHNLVPFSRRMAVLFYRIFQVIANVWLPMVLLWIVSPFIVVPLWVLLWIVPPFLSVGREIFKEPRHIITPSFVSLHGIAGAENQRSGSHDYAFSMVRPIIFVGAVSLLGHTVVHVSLAAGASEVTIGNWVLNPVGFWRAGVEDEMGNIVLYTAACIAIIGTSFHILLTMLPVLKSLLGREDDARIIKFDTDEDLRTEFNELVQKVCVAAHFDKNDDKDRVNEHNVETLSKFNVLVALSLAVIDLCAYAYKIFTFLRDGRYPLAAVMTVAVVEALTTLVIHGHLAKASKAVRKTAVTGIPTVHFLALVQWDDGLAGIPCLFLTVYGLPLTRIDTWITCVTSIFFLISGTRALAVYLQDVTDADMYAVPKEWYHVVDEDEEAEE